MEPTEDARATRELIVVLRSPFPCSGAHVSCSGDHFRAQELIFMIRRSFSCSGAHHFVLRRRRLAVVSRLPDCDAMGVSVHVAGARDN